MKDHQDHHDALQGAVDWLTLMKDRLSTCSDTSGDRHTLQNKLERVKVSVYRASDMIVLTVMILSY